LLVHPDPADGGTILKAEGRSNIPLSSWLLRQAHNHLNPAWRFRPEFLQMIYVLAALLPPVGLLLNGQPFSAILNLILIVFCVIFGLVFHILFLVPSAHALIAVHMKREERRHREVVEAIRQHGPPPGYPR
jgi:hypothetical protein